tara:strand:+ start:610 stop:861 length:252 start_codon:yes stop_codon:yes gene_type:complete
MLGIKKKNNRYQIDEGIFQIFKVLMGGDIDIKKMKDKDLSKKGKELKKAALGFEKELLAKAKKAGFNNLDDYVAHQKKELGYT